MKNWLNPRSIFGITLITVALIALPFVAAMGGQAWVRIMNFAILYIFLALGLNIVVGFAGLLDLGYIAFYAVGAYVYALLASPHFGLHLPFWVILPIGAMVACVLWCPARFANAQAARRLSGHRHARFR
jgi:branched-chain amino acid transport system permease protein